MKTGQDVDKARTSSRGALVIKATVSLLFVGLFVVGRMVLVASVTGETLRMTGMLAELFVGAALASLVICLSRVHVVLAAIFLVSGVLLYVANMEMVLALQSVIRLQVAFYGIGRTFLEGSAGDPAFLWFALLSLLTGGVYLWVWHRRPPRGLRVPLIVLTASFLLALLVTPFPLSGDSWTDGSLVWRSVTASLLDVGHAANDRSRPATAAEGAESIRSHSEEQRPPFDEPLSDRPGQERPNILLVVTEGIPGGYVRQSQEYTGVEYPVVMERLSDMADDFRIFPNAVAPNQQTIRGLYAILTGDYPRLDLSTPKAYEYMQRSERERPRALPDALSAVGYRTAYLQAAPLSYMSKDQTMQAMGFEEIVGEEYFDYTYASSGWGPDDKAFFEQSTEYLKELSQSDSPWFVTLLNVGSHHPYAVPEEFAERYDSRKEAAVHYLDEALGEFYDRLSRDGVLEDTLMLIVSDESHGMGGQPYGRYWPVVMVRGPGIEAGTETVRVSQIDVTWTVLSYLGARHQPRLIPRTNMLAPSEADRQRAVAFGRHFSSAPDTVYEVLSNTRVRRFAPAPGLFAKSYDPVLLPREDATAVVEELETWRSEEG